MINLLPPLLREELREETRFRLVLIVGVLLSLFFLCLSLSLLAIRVYVSGEIQTQKILVESQKKQGGEPHLQQIRELNGDIAGVASFYDSRVLVSDIAARIASALPEEMYLTSLTFTPPPESKVTLQGFAPLQEDLLEFRTNLERNPAFRNFHFPLSNWSSAADINFSFDFAL